MTPYTEYPSPPSLWEATAIDSTPCARLSEQLHVDVAIIGGGYTGLSTALHLAESGVRVALLESETIGWGGSGRNGGQVIPGVKHDPEELIKRFGEEQGERLIHFAASTADIVFTLIDQHNIPCHPVRQGWIQAVHTSQYLKTVEHRAQQWASRGVQLEIFNQQQAQERTGSKTYIGGWIDYRAGCLHPLNYALGLKKACLQLGVQIFENTRVSAVEQMQSGAWQLNTPKGQIQAEKVLLATNAYTSPLVGQLHKTLLKAQSFVIATAPLSAELAATVLPTGAVCSDTRRSLVYFRKDAENRVVLGGRGKVSDPRNTQEWQHTEKELRQLFPQLAQTPIEYRWSGRIAITPDFMPHLHEPKPNLLIAIGYNGRGVGLATALGPQLAAYLQNPKHPLPLPITPITAIPAHFLQKLYLSAGITWYRFLDTIF